MDLFNDMMKTLFFFGVLVFPQLLLSQVTPSNTCKQTPPLARKLGFTNTVAITTSYPGKKGLIMADPGNMTKYFQDSSWALKGNLGSFSTDENGNIFVLPAPHVDLNDNPPSNCNDVYKIDGSTGKLSLFVKLPGLIIDNPNNAYGVLGIAYHCKFKCFYVSTVNGSTRKNEIGRIYQVSSESGKILDSIIQFDAYGLSAMTIGEDDYLFSGATRNSNLYQLRLNKKGGFVNEQPEPILSIAGLGSRGDDRIKKIDFDTSKFVLIVKGNEFNFNLSAPSESQQSTYFFSWDGQKWQQLR